MSTSSRSSFSPRDRRMCSSSPNIMVAFHFVVELKTFNKVLKGSSILGFLDIRVDGVEFLKLDESLSLLLSSSKFVNHLQGRVEVETAKAVTKIKHVHSSFALKVIDVKSKLSTFNVLGVEVGHFDEL